MSAPENEVEAGGGRGGPVRVVDLKILSHLQSEQLFGPGVRVSRCRLVLRHMMPAGAEGRLRAVQDHGVVLEFSEGKGVMIPWGQISYATFEEGE